MKFWTEFKVELIIFLIGTIISIISSVKNIGGSLSIALAIFIITLSTDIIVISVKHYLKNLLEEYSSKILKTISSFFECSFEFMLHGNKIDDRWEGKFSQALQDFKGRIEGLYNGDLSLSYDELFFYQNELIKNTKKKLYAIHVADSVESLKLWDPNRTEASKFKSATYYACKELKKNVEKKRLFLLSKDIEKNEEKLIKNVVQNQKTALNFSVKKIYIEDINQKYKIPYDTIISDEKEVIEIIMRFDKVESAHSYINKEKVYNSVSDFKKLWGIADEFEFDKKDVQEKESKQ